MVVEPSGATGVAGARRLAPPGATGVHVAVVSGGNVEPAVFADLLRDSRSY
jgi:threonine dehydratase